MKAVSAGNGAPSGGGAPACVLELRNMGKHFGGLHAVRDVNLEVHVGQIIGLVGANGAGKTTLLNCIAGTVRADEGKVLFEGRDVTGLRAERRCRIGISRTFQLPRSFPSLSVLETVLVATWAGKGARFRQTALDAAAEALELARVRNSPDAPVRELTTGDLRRLDLARALATKPRLLLLDEIAAGSTSSELDELLDIVLQIKASGTTVVIVEHILHAIGALCERVVLLDSGKILLDGPTEQVVSDPLFSSHYLGISA